MCLQRNAIELRAEAALTLATTPYVMLTSIPGIGFVLAAGLAGELGDPKNLGKLDSLCGYAGIVPSTMNNSGNRWLPPPAPISAFRPGSQQLKKAQ